MLVQEGKVARAIFPPWWDDDVQDELLLVQEGKLVPASFPPQRDDAYEMSSCLCKR
jgi:hypothetical protein